MVQTSVETSLVKGLAGQLADISKSVVITRANNTKQREIVTVSAANKLTTLTLNSTAFTVNSTSATKTIAELVELLETAVGAGSEPVTVVATDSTTLTIEANVSGTAFTATGTTNCSATTSITNDEASNMPAGVLVCQDSSSGNANTCKLPYGATDISTANIPLGVSVRTQSQENASSGDTYLEKERAVSIAVEGNVWVRVETAVTPLSSVWVRHTVSASGSLGAFRADSAGGLAGAFSGARFLTTADAGDVALLRINRP